MENFDAMNEARRVAWETQEKAYQKEQRKEFFRRKVASVGTWIDKNSEAILALTPVAVVAARTVTNLVRTVGYQVNRREEKKHRDFTCYDRSEAHYWNLKRKLTNADWTKINARKASGERLGDILKEMKVLK